MWKCKCGRENEDDYPYCAYCGGKRPKPEPRRDEGWRCSCGSVNSAEFLYCQRCGKPKPRNAGGKKKSGRTAFAVAAALIGILLAAALVLCLFVRKGHDDAADWIERGKGAKKLESGLCGDDLTWKMYSDGVLVISGEGEMRDYDADYDRSPWEQYVPEIRAVIIEEGVESIGGNAFREHENLKEVHVGASVTSIDEYAFSYCVKLKSIRLPGTLETIGESAFAFCTGLTDINIPGSVTDVCPLAFAFCQNLISITVDGSNPRYCAKNQCLIDTITKTVIAGCESSIIPADGSVTAIGDEAFCGCGFSSLTIPSGVTKLDNWALSSCGNLQKLSLPASVTEIGFGTFSDCSALTDVYYEGSAADRDRIAIDDCNEELMNAVWHYAVEDAPTPTPAPTPAPTPTPTPAPTPAPFYGIFCFASVEGNKAAADRVAQNLAAHGFPNAGVVLTTEWSVLNERRIQANKDPHYVVTAGFYSSEWEAESELDRMKQVFSELYPNEGTPYIVYSGDYIG